MPLKSDTDNNAHVMSTSWDLPVCLFIYPAIVLSDSMENWPALRGSTALSRGAADSTAIRREPQFRCNIKQRFRLHASLSRLSFLSLRLWLFHHAAPPVFFFFCMTISCFFSSNFCVSFLSVSVCISCYFPAFLPFFPPSVFLLHFYSNFFFLPLYEKHFSSSYLYICPSLHHIYHLFYVSLIFFTLSLTYLHTYQPAWMFAFWSACVRAHPTRASSASGPFPPNRAGVNMQERAWLHISTDSVHTASSIKSLF